MTEDGRIAQLEHQVAVLAWLHTELLYNLDALMKRFLGQPPAPVPGQQPDPAALAHQQAVRARAVRIAQIRKENATLYQGGPQ